MKQDEESTPPEEKRSTRANSSLIGSAPVWSLRARVHAGPVHAGSRMSLLSVVVRHCWARKARRYQLPQQQENLPAWFPPLPKTL
jgi:hypothetical protein